MLPLISRKFLPFFLLLFSLAFAQQAAAGILPNCKQNPNYSWVTDLYCGGALVKGYNSVTECLQAGKALCGSACEATTASCKQNPSYSWITDLYCGETLVKGYNSVTECLSAAKELCP